MSKLFRLHIIFAIFCLFCFEQVMNERVSINRTAPKGYSSRIHARMASSDLLELTEEDDIKESHTLLSVFNRLDRPCFIFSISFTSRIVTTCATILFQSDMSPPSCVVIA